MVDLNRAGIGLMEIVSEADFRSSEQVGLYLKQLQQMMKHIGSSDANMQLGEMRCDINISVRPPDAELGTRVELKNMISIKAIMSAIDAEARRQIEMLESGERIKRETRGFDQESGSTFHMRTKEDEVDYRFFPEPDIPPIILSQEFIDSIKETMGEMPDDMKKRIIKTYGITEDDATMLVEDQLTVRYFEDVVSFGGGNRSAKKVLPWILKEIFEWLNIKNERMVNNPISVDRMALFLDLIEQGFISARTGKEIIAMMLNGDKRDPKTIVESLGLSQISDDSTLESLCRTIVEKHPKEATDYRSGKQRAFKFFVGEVMKQTKGRSNPEKVNAFLLKLLQ
eukprot:gene14378-16966_t